jgi:hypothetical protein
MADDVQMPLTPAARRMIDRDHAGRGGFQTLLRRLRSQLSVDKTTVAMSPGDFEKWVRYATKYGEGGFENRLRSLNRPAKKR